MSRTMTVLLPYSRGDLVTAAHEETHLVSERHTAEGTRLVLQVPDALARRFEPFEVTAVEENQE
jgi:GTPase